MKLVNCKACGKEVGKNVKKCPHCGTDQRNWFMRHKIITFFGIVVVLAIISSLLGGEEEAVTASVGESISTEKFEITVTSIEVRNSVGSGFFATEPSEGGIFVVVRWKYKNISDEPIGSFSTPIVKLVNSKNTEFSADIDASSTYATEVGFEEKILSDLNPGISVNAAAVFEVSEDLLKEDDGWRVLIDADQDIYIPFDYEG